MDVQVRVHEDFDLGGGASLTQGIHSLPIEDLPSYEAAILDGRMFFPLEINEFKALNQQLNEQIYNLYQSDLEIIGSIPSVPLTTKGDILGRSSLGNDRIPVGANDTILIADSAQTRGVKWSSLIASQIPNLDASKITTGTIAPARLGSGTPSSANFLRGDSSWQAIPPTAPAGSNTQVQYNNSGAFGASAKMIFDGNDFSLVNPTAATGGSPSQNSPYFKLSGALWNGSISQNQSARMSIKPVATNDAARPSPNFTIESFSNFLSSWTDIFMVGASPSDFMTTRMKLQNPNFGWGGFLDVSYDSIFTFKDLGGNLSRLATFAIGNGNGVACDSFYINSYQPEIRAYFNGKILFASGRISDGANGWGSEYVQSDLPIGIGVSGAPSARLHVKGTTTQRRSDYDGFNYLTETIASDGSRIVDIVGSNPQTTFNDPILGLHKKRNRSQSSVATLTPNVGLYDMETLTAQTGNLTIANPTGTPIDNQSLWIRITSAVLGFDNISYGSKYSGGASVILPATTPASSQTDYLEFTYFAAQDMWHLTRYADGY